MSNRFFLSLPVIFFGLIVGNVVNANDVNSKINVSGDMRTGYFSLYRDDRNGSRDITDEFRLRLRVGLALSLTDTMMAKIRLAGRYSTDDRNDNHFEFFDSIPAGDGLRRGDSTIDELYLQYKLSRQWAVKLGRLQTKFEAKGVAKKSLDRNNSPNTDINWMDGVYVTYVADNGWNTHVIMQYNPPQGATEVRRGTFDFNADNSRVSYFVGWENKQALGPIVQRGFDISYLPESLQQTVDANGPVVDYWGFVGRLAAQWPLSSGMKLLLSGEVGYAPTTPTKATLSTGGDEDSRGVAAYISFNLIDFYPQHSIGLVTGHTGGGWLLSPDFRNNSRAIEVRYAWKLDKQQKIEIRVRNRRELEQRTTALQKRDDDDLYVRYTLKF